MLVKKVPAFSRVRVLRLGSLDSPEEEGKLRNQAVVTWTELQPTDDPFETVRVRGVWSGDHGLCWLSGDADVELLEGPRFLGDPADLVKAARPWKKPAGALGSVQTSEGWHPLIWKSDPLFTSVVGWNDPEVASEIILCALTHAPDDEVRDTLLAALNAQYATLLEAPDVYPESRFPWRLSSFPDELTQRIMR